MNRTRFGVHPQVRNQYVGLSSQEAAKRILDEAENEPLPSRPPFNGDFDDDRETMDRYVRREFYNRMRTRGLSERLTLFWYNHFVTSFLYNGVRAYDYYEMLRRNSIGTPLKDFVHEVGLNPHMLYYLDGRRNRAGTPNENYARELMELFTMGQFGPDGSKNYDETDIKELSRALTGWDTENEQTIFIPLHFDDGVKTFLGRTGTWGYDQVIDILFEERAPQIAHFMCRKFYAYFVNPVPDEAIVAQLAQIYQSNNFQIRPVLETLFASAHFFDVGHRGCRIKSTLEYWVGACASFEIPVGTEGGRWITYDMQKYIDFDVFFPPNVAGWPGFNPPDSSGVPGDESWVDVLRVSWATQLLQDLMNEKYEDTVPSMTAWAQANSNLEDPYRLAMDVANLLIAVPLADASIVHLEEPISGTVPGNVTSAPAKEQDLVKVLLDGQQYNRWTNMSMQNKEDALRRYVMYVASEVPESMIY